MDQIFDTALVEQAKAGDQQAFAELYTRWYDPVYDFVVHMTRSRDQAHDIGRDTFQKALHALGGLPRGASFRTWVFTIARNTTLTCMRDAQGAGAGSRSSGVTATDDVAFDTLDSRRFPGAGQSVEAAAIAPLVWEGAIGLDPRQRSLLDLHLRHGFDHTDIAQVLGVTGKSGDVTLRRLKGTAEDALRAHIMLKEGRKHCPNLDALLSAGNHIEMSPETRRLVDAHVEECPACGQRRARLLSPLAVFGAFATANSSPEVKAATYDGLMRQWSGVAAGGRLPPPPPDDPVGLFPGDLPDGRGPAGGPTAGTARYVVGGGIAALLLLGAVLVPSSPLSPLDEGGSANQAAAGDDGGGPPFGAVTETATRTPTRRPATPTPGRTATAPAGAATSPAPTSAPTATTGPGTPTPTNSATVTATHTATATPTATATATPTNVPCSASISTNTGTLVVEPVDTSSFVLLASCSSSSFAVSGGDSWATAVPVSGVVAFGSPRTIQVTVDASNLSEGPHTTTLAIQGQHNATSVVVSTNVPGAAPSVSVLQVSCSSASSTFAIQVNASDDFRVSSVVVRLHMGGSSSTHALSGPDGAVSGTWERSLSDVPGVTSWTVLATDGVGKTGTAGGACS